MLSSKSEASGSARRASRDSCSSSLHRSASSPGRTHASGRPPRPGRPEPSHQGPRPHCHPPSPRHEPLQGLQRPKLNSRPQRPFCTYDSPGASLSSCSPRKPVRTESCRGFHTFLRSTDLDSVMKKAKEASTAPGRVPGPRGGSSEERSRA